MIYIYIFLGLVSLLAGGQVGGGGCPMLTCHITVAVMKIFLILPGQNVAIVVSLMLRHPDVILIILQLGTPSKKKM